MSIDCGQFSGTNNCRFSNAAGSYFTMDEAYEAVEAPSAALALQSNCPKGMNVSEMNSLTSFSNQAFGAFNKPPGQDKGHAQ
jgi:hypothetical protein